MKEVEVHVEVCDNTKEYIEDLPEEVQEYHNHLISRFTDLKKSDLAYSPDNFPTVNEYVQTQYPCTDVYLGKDRVFDMPPHLYAEIHQENMAHIHVNNGTWKEYTKQWKQGSKLAMVYSAFTHRQAYYFYILELLLDSTEDAHDYYKSDELLEEWLEDAKTYRLSIQKQ
ncbi:MAG: hypothetical protein GY787_07720 [Alteromonadales bacterium]|nr:hypothetical protein [Alteromonadales bacterium]